MEKRRERVFIISLDGATFSVLRPLMEQGCLPTLSRFMAASVSAELQSVIPPVTAPAWTSFMTGKQPGKHGILDFSRFNPANYTWSINNSQDIQSKTLWQLLSEHGKRVVVLNLPYTYPPYDVNGIVVSGWDAPFKDPAFSRPEKVGYDILQRFPDYKDNLWVSELHPLRDHTQFAEFVRKIRLGFEQQTQIALDLMGREPWDVFMVHFQQTDWIQHKLWTYIEQGCSNPNDHRSEIDSARDCYRYFDECCGRLLDEVSSLQATTIVLSDHGFGPLLDTVNPNFYLKEWGYLSLHAQQRTSLGGFRQIIRNSKSQTVRKLYRSMAAARNHFTSRDNTKHESWADNAQDVMGARGATWDWNRTKAAMVYAYQMGFIYVNAIDRGPRGIVQPGSEYESIVTDVTQRFRDIRHPRTGERLLQDVVRGNAIYCSAAPGVLIPDLVLIPAGGYGFSFSVSAAMSGPSKEGTHRHNGVLLIKGDAIHRPKSRFEPFLIDMAPTILHLLGLPVPRDMDGKVLLEIMTDQQSVCYDDAHTEMLPIRAQYSAEEEQLVAQRLKGLGYLD